MTQRERLMDLFKTNPNTWIPLPRITGLGIAMYPPRIKELREEELMNIINKIERVEGIRHSFYMYIPFNVERERKKEGQELFDFACSLARTQVEAPQI